MHELLREAGGFAASLLAGGQEWLAQHFARGVPPIGMWSGVATEEGARGAPLLVGALGWLECRLASEHAAGDHSFFVGEVESARLGEPRAAARPLRRRVPDAVIAAVVFDLDGVILQTRGGLGRGARPLRRRARRPLRRRGAAGDDGDERAGVVAVPAARSSACPGRRRRSAPTSCALMEARYREELPLIPGARRGGRAARGALAARARVVVEPAADRRRARAVGTGPVLPGHGLVGGGRAGQARAGRVPRGGAPAGRVRPSDCVAVEDSHAGIRSAKAAGMRVIAIPNPSFPPGAEALGARRPRARLDRELTVARVESLARG